MYLKYLMITLCCVMSSVQAKKFNGSKSLGALPSAVVIFSKEKATVDNDAKPNSAVLDSSAEISNVQASSTQVFYDFPGANSPVYSPAQECTRIFAALSGQNSPLRLAFPCAR